MATTDHVDGDRAGGRGATRRAFLGATLAAGAAVGLGTIGVRSALARDDAAPRRKLRVLVLGGTGQTGPHLVRILKDRGHTVTLFNRGNRSDELFPNVECIVGNRYPEIDPGLEPLRAEVGRGREWDVVMDSWPHIPRLVDATASLLEGSCGHYLFISSMSVYADNSVVGQDETAELQRVEDADAMEYTPQLFGAFKAACEDRVREHFPERHTIFRPGLIVGPRDFSFRGVYWPVRVRDGGTVLAPGDGTTPVQMIDGRDLAAFEARCMEQRSFGVFNVVGPAPANAMTMRDYLRACREGAGSDARFEWVDAAFLAQQGVGPWMQMPCWVPAEGAYAGFGSRSAARAIAAGLTFRPPAETARDTLAWWDALEEDERASLAGRAGITREKEAEVLGAWAERGGDDGEPGG